MKKEKKQDYTIAPYHHHNLQSTQTNEIRNPTQTNEIIKSRVRKNSEDAISIYHILCQKNTIM